jgi:L-ribulose-5-phosphate 4-epimerase
MKKELLKECLELNIFLKQSGLVKLTWGNASVISDDYDKIAIKPSGVQVSDLNIKDLSIVDLQTGKKTLGLKPSVDTNIHLEIYRAFPETKYIIHSHSKFATSFAQAGTEIPILGTTHADYFPGNIPLIKSLSEVEYDDYETNIGRKVVRYLLKNNRTPNQVRAVLLENHGVLLFSSDLKNIKESAIVLEEVAEMALYTMLINSKRKMLEKDFALFDKHFQRKNGKDKYYGQ